MKIYNENVWPTIKSYDVKILAAYGPKDVREGPESEGIIVMEFPAGKRRGPRRTTLRIAKCARIDCKAQGIARRDRASV